MATARGKREGYINLKSIKKGKRPEFSEGNPGRPEGSKNKVTLLKEKILNAILGRDLNAEKIIYIKRKGKKTLRIVSQEVSTTDLMKVGATFVPKELKGEGFEGKHITIVYPGLKDGPKPSSDNRLRPTAKAKGLSRKSAKV